METNKPKDKALGDETNFAKLTPEEQREASKKHTPPDHQEQAINEKLALENRKKYQQEQAKNIN